MEDTKARWAGGFLKIPSDRRRVPVLLEHVRRFARFGSTAKLTLKASISLFVLGLLIRVLPFLARLEKNLKSIKSKEMKFPDLPQSLKLHNFMFCGTPDQAFPIFGVLLDDAVPVCKVSLWIG
jgi:hypothetical protein